MGVFNPLKTMEYLTSSDYIIDKGIKYFEVEVINTNENTLGYYFKENQYLTEETMYTRLNK